MAKAICRRFRGKPLLDYVYRDYGSLVALGRFSTVGNLMGGLTGGGIMIEGVLRLVYWSLHKMHPIALHGGFKTALTTSLTSSARRPGRASSCIDSGIVPPASTLKGIKGRPWLSPQAP